MFKCTSLTVWSGMLSLHVLLYIQQLAYKKQILQEIAFTLFVSTNGLKIKTMLANNRKCNFQQITQACCWGVSHNLVRALEEAVINWVDLPLFVVRGSLK